MKNLILLSNGGKNRNYEEYIYSKFLLDKKLTKEITVDNYPDSQKLLKLINQLSKIYFDNIYAIGGGSVLDIAKVLSVFCLLQMTTTYKIYLKRTWIFIVKKIYLTAIPTTSGTGAEVTQFATIWDNVNLKKYSVDHPVFYQTNTYLIQHF